MAATLRFRSLSLVPQMCDGHAQITGTGQRELRILVELPDGIAA